MISDGVAKPGDGDIDMLNRVLRVSRRVDQPLGRDCDCHVIRIKTTPYEQKR
jgi:hypothetical protein